MILLLLALLNADRVHLPPLQLNSRLSAIAQHAAAAHRDPIIKLSGHEVWAGGNLVTNAASVQVGNWSLMLSAPHRANIRHYARGCTEAVGIGISKHVYTELFVVSCK